MSYTTACLNCEEPISKNFCSNCGQKTDTHRINFKHFIFHDILHGVWHFEKGILFTLKEALICPGKAALDYISGKRIKYYNVFYLILIIIGLTLFINSIYNKLALKFYNISNRIETDNAGNLIDKFITDYSKLIIFSFVPLFAINSYLIYRRKKLNLSEHFIIAGMIFLGVISIVFVGEIFYLTEFVRYIDFISTIINFAVPFSILCYVLINYYRTFKHEYNTLRMFCKTILFLLLLLAEIVIIILLLIGYFSNWTFTLKYVYS